MMTEIAAVEPAGFLFMKQENRLLMRNDDDYIPIEIWREAKKFIQDITDDVEIYKKIKNFDSVKQNDEADKFVVWWDFKRYTEYHHALILLYENTKWINEVVGSYDVLDGLNKLQVKLIFYYRLLKQWGMINE